MLVSSSLPSAALTAHLERRTAEQSYLLPAGPRPPQLWEMASRLVVGGPGNDHDTTPDARVSARTEGRGIVVCENGVSRQPSWMSGRPGLVPTVAISDDGERILWQDEDMLIINAQPMGMSKYAIVSSPTHGGGNGNVVLFKTQQRASALDFAPGGNKLVLAFDNQVQEWQPTLAQPRAVMDMPAPIRMVRYLTDGTLAIRTQDDRFYCVTPASRGLYEVLWEPSGGVVGVVRQSELPWQAKTPATPRCHFYDLVTDGEIDAEALRQRPEHAWFHDRLGEPGAGVPPRIDVSPDQKTVVIGGVRVQRNTQAS